MNFLKTMVLVAVTTMFSASIVLAEDSDPVREKASSVEKVAVGGEPDNLSVNPVVYINEGGDFQITFPRGCGKLVTRANEPDLFAGEEWDDIVQVSYVFCDRFQKEGEGCSVKSTFNLHDKDGDMAGPEQVVPRVESALKHFQASIVKQESVKKQFENGIQVEGVEILARPENSKGEVWIRGLLVEGDIYILTAWKDQGGLWKDPEYMMFFNSFQPWTE